MESGNIVHFEVGQSVESRSFLKGFRGAWFRCQIKEISKRKGEDGVVLMHYDFPDEKMVWTKLYRRFHGKKCIMIRPWFPPIFQACMLQEVKSSPEVYVVVNDSWKVGDAVDWWTDNTYWSSRIIAKLDHEKFQVELWPPPHGEGSCYKAFGKDLRPTLTWSPQDGWKVDEPKEGGNMEPCAHLIYRSRDSITSVENVDPRSPINSSGIPDEVCADPGDLNESSNRSRSTSIQPRADSQGVAEAASLMHDGCAMQVDEAPSERTYRLADRRIADEEHSSKRMRTECDVLFDPVESTLLDIEVLLNRVKWMKRILKRDIPLPVS